MFESETNISVFILEDYSTGDFQKLIRTDMEQSNVQVVSVLSPEDLKLRIHRERADAIIIDFDFPDIDCCQLINEILTSLNKRQNLPVFALLQKDQPVESYQDLFQFQSCHFIRKHLPKQEVVGLISCALKSRVCHNDLAEAREILRHHRNQFNSLIHSHLPDTKQFDYDGWKFQGHLACRSLYGGDFYDLYPVNDSTVAIMSGDCIGSGLSALVFLSRVQGQMRGLLQHSHDPAIILKQLNNLFQDRNQEFGEFFCLFLGILDCNSGLLTYASAGQSGPMIVDRETMACTDIIKATDPPIGVDPIMDFTTEQVQIEIGSRLCLYTNGLWENPGEDGKPLGYETLSELLTRTASLDQQASIIKIFNSLHLVKNSLPNDDAALLLIDRES